MARATPSKGSTNIQSPAKFETYRYVFALLFGICSVLAAYYIHIIGAVDNNNMSRMVESGKLEHGVRLRKHYTGFATLDSGLSHLVAAFIGGPANFDLSIYLQQVHFLLGFFPIISIWTVESIRQRNQKTVVSFTSIWALFYQTVGGAIIVPLHGLCYVFISRRKQYLTTGRAVPLYKAQALILSLILGYLIPTVLMYIPAMIVMHYPSQLKINDVMALVAYWQITPLVVNSFLGLFSNILAMVDETPAPAPSSRPVRLDVPILKTLYAICIFVSTASHCFVLYTISGTDGVTFSSVFIPDLSNTVGSLSQGIHYIFQWDWIIIASSQLLWAWFTVFELRSFGIRILDLAVAGVLILVCATAMGPGGALAAVWWWREDKHIEIEQDAQVDKPKTS